MRHTSCVTYNCVSHQSACADWAGSGSRSTAGPRFVLTNRESDTCASQPMRQPEREVPVEIKTTRQSTAADSASKPERPWIRSMVAPQTGRIGKTLPPRPAWDRTLDEAGEPRDYFFRWPETNLVISNMLTLFLPLKTACKLSSALIWVRTFLSCRPFFRIYTQSFLVNSVRGSGAAPTTLASLSSGWTGFMNAALGLRFDFVFVAIRLFIDCLPAECNKKLTVFCIFFRPPSGPRPPPGRRTGDKRGGHAGDATERAGGAAHFALCRLGRAGRLEG